MVECSPVEITVAHSPDSDDAFMFYALSTGKIDTGDLGFRFVLKDIESLNWAANEGIFDVTAISFAAYPSLAAAYQLLPCGASLGIGYGPVVVSRNPISKDSLRNARIAVPGRMTSAFLTLKLFLGSDPNADEVRFDRIMHEVAAGHFDAGVIIHEGQLTYEDLNLQRVADLGEWWHGETGLPLPLGANAVRRSLNLEVKTAVARCLRESISYGFEHHEEALGYALDFGRGVQKEQAERFVHMYVNDYTLDIGAIGRQAVETFLICGFPEEYRAGSIPFDYVD